MHMYMNSPPVPTPHPEQEGTSVVGGLFKAKNGKGRGVTSMSGLLACPGFLGRRGYVYGCVKLAKPPV